MSKHDRPENRGQLFDFPLHAKDEDEGDQPLNDAGDLHIGRSYAAPADEAYDVLRPGTGEPGESEEPEEPDETEERPAPVRDRLLSGVLDLGIQLLVIGAAVASSRAMGLELGLDDWPPFAILGLIFSFLYWFIPLAFWGQTPGMAWVGNSSLSLTDDPLTFGQSVLRWFGALLTLALAGLPLLFALRGRSLTDRLSDSKTVVL